MLFIIAIIKFAAACPPLPPTRVIREVTYDSECRVQSIETFSKDGRSTGFREYSYEGLTQGDFIVTHRGGDIEERSGIPGNLASQTLHRRWEPLPGLPGTFQLDEFDEDQRRPLRRSILENDQAERVFSFTYRNADPHDKHLREVVSDSGYTYTEDLEYIDLPWSSLELIGHLTEPADIIIFDTGFNLDLPFLQPHLVAGEIQNLQFESYDYSVYGNFNELLDLPQHGAPYSHGSSVASVALRDLSRNVTVFPIGGDLLNQRVLDLLDAVTLQLQPKFANWSLGAANQRTIEAGVISHGLEYLMSQTPDTLHIVAAGNFAAPLSLEEVPRTYPACAEAPNLLSVGALAQDYRISEARVYEIRLADFNNPHADCIDIYALGVDVPVTNVFNEQEKLVGTSFAAPKVLNTATRISEQYPNLHPLSIRDAIFYSALVPETPLPSLSGGVLFEERAFRLARLLSEGKELKEAIQMARSETAITNEYPTSAVFTLWGLEP